MTDAVRAARQAAILLIALFFAAAAIGYWVGQGRPVTVGEAAADRVQCLSYAPFRKPGESPFIAGTMVGEARLREDLELLAARTGCVRTYSVQQGLEAVPRIAQSLGMKVLRTRDMPDQKYALTFLAFGQGTLQDFRQLGLINFYTVLVGGNNDFAVHHFNLGIYWRAANITRKLLGKELQRSGVERVGKASPAIAERVCDPDKRKRSFSTNPIGSIYARSSIAARAQLVALDHVFLLA